MPTPRVPTHLKLLRGNPSKRALPKHEPHPHIEAELPEPPVTITGYASDEWHRVGKEMHRLRLLTVVDYAALAAYCTAYQKWRKAEEALNEMRSRDPKLHGLLISHNGVGVINPLIRVSFMAAEQMLKIAGEFGFTPAARARIAMGIDTPPGGGKFDGLLAG